MGCTSIVVCRGKKIARARLARDPLTRLVGWIGRTPPQGEALWLEPCFSVHTFGMKVPIDVVFVDRSGCVLKVLRSLRPWRLVFCPGARAAVEFAEGGAEDVREGMKVALRSEGA